LARAPCPAPLPHSPAPPPSARKVVAISRGGLERRGHDEAHFLRQLEEIADSGLTPADRLLQLYNGPWGGSVEPIYSELLY
jgi:glutamate--cysteine ligase